VGLFAPGILVHLDRVTGFAVVGRDDDIDSVVEVLKIVLVTFGI